MTGGHHPVFASVAKEIVSNLFDPPTDKDVGCLTIVLLKVSDG
jgi:hypothetical protein